MEHFLVQSSNLPLYNTRAVSLETGVPADTFRAWERRYGLPHPQRTAGGHRLYSERDIALVRWLRDRTAEGLTISQAIALLHNKQAQTLNPVQPMAQNWVQGQKQLLAALIAFDERSADNFLSEAFILHSVETVLLNLIVPTMIEIGEQWHQGKIYIATEHFASQFIRQRLAALLNNYRTNSLNGQTKMLLGCAPSEQHDLGLLILAVFFARRGCSIVFLGSGVPENDLIQTVKVLGANVVCLSASMPETGRELISIGTALAKFPAPQPRFYYGGRAFLLDPKLCSQIPGKFLGNDLPTAVEQLAQEMP